MVVPIALERIIAAGMYGRITQVITSYWFGLTGKGNYNRDTVMNDIAKLKTYQDRLRVPLNVSNVEKIEADVNRLENNPQCNEIEDTLSDNSIETAKHQKVEASDRCGAMAEDSYKSKSRGRGLNAEVALVEKERNANAPVPNIEKTWDKLDGRPVIPIQLLISQNRKHKRRLKLYMIYLALIKRNFGKAIKLRLE